MNSVLLKKTVSNIYILKISRKSFCSKVVKVASSTTGEPSNEHGKKQSISKSIPQYDIAIVGGGMVGMAFACFLASMPLTKQLNVAIIDSNPALGSSLSIKKEDLPDPRVSTITPATISFLRDAGAWKYVEQNRHAYFNKMQLSCSVVYRHGPWTGRSGPYQRVRLPSEVWAGQVKFGLTCWKTKVKAHSTTKTSNH